MQEVLSKSLPNNTGIEDVCDMIGVVNKAAPNQMRQHLPGPDPTPNKEVGAMANYSNTTLTDHQIIAVDYLERCRAQMERAAANRILYIKLSRKYGLTNQRIADALGITESAVRGLVERHGGDQ